MNATRLWLHSPRPLHLESLANYRGRLLEINHETQAQLNHLIAQMAEHDPGAGEIDVLEAKSGRELSRLTSSELPANGHGTDCGLCTDGIHTRWACLDCAHGQHVAQQTHFAQNVCIKHRRWIGPDSAPQRSSQPHVGRRTITAEREFRRLLAQGRIDAHLYTLIDHAVRTALRTLHGYQEYPLVIALLDTLTRPGIATALIDPTRSFAQAHALLRSLIERVAHVAEDNVDRIAGALWIALRPTFLTARERLTDPGLPLPAHEILLKDVPDASHKGFVGPLEPFERYLRAGGVRFTQRNKVILLTDYSRTTRTQMGSEDSRAERPLICLYGHRCRGRVSKVLHASTAGEGFCPVCELTELVPGVNSLDLTHPLVAADLDTMDAGAMAAAGLLATSRAPVPWICGKGHRLIESPASRVADGCRLCSYKLVTPVNSLRTEHPKIARMFIAERTRAYSVDTLHARSTAIVWWLCKNGHTFRNTPANLVAGAGCHFCRTNRRNARTVAAHPLLVDEWDHARNDCAPDEVSIGRRTHVAWICPSGHSFHESPYMRDRGYGCPDCGNPRKLRRGHNDAATIEPVLMREFSRDNGPIEPQDLVATGTRPLRWTCLTCGHATTQSVPERKAAGGCPDCPPRERILNVTHGQEAA